MNFDFSPSFLQSNPWKKTYHAVYLILPFLAGMYFFPLQLTGIHLERIPGDLGDARLLNYILEHGFQFITGKQSSFYDAPFFYPNLNTLSLSDNMIGSLPVYSLFRFLQFDRETSFQLWWLAGFALNYFIAFVCFKKFSSNFGASVIVAWLFTFSMLNLPHLNYVQVNHKYMLPVIFTFFFDWLKTNNNRSFFILMLAFCLQIFVNIYYFTFAILFISVISLVHFAFSKSFEPYIGLFRHPIKNKYHWLAFLMLILATMLCLYPYTTTLGSSVRFRNYENVVGFIPKFQSFISAGIPTYWSERIGIGDKYFPVSWWFHQFFPGIFTFIILLITPLFLFLKRKKVNRTMLLIFTSFLLLFFICIRWTEDFSPLKYLYDIKFLGAITFISRLMIPLELLFLYLALTIIDQSLKNSRKPVAIFSLFIILLFVMWDNSIDGTKLSGLDKASVKLKYEKIEEIIKKQNQTHLKTLALVDENVTSKAFILDAMMVSQNLGMNCINGHSSNAPTNVASDFWMFPNRGTLNLYCKASGIDIQNILIIDNPN